MVKNNLVTLCFKKSKYCKYLHVNSVVTGFAETRSRNPYGGKCWSCGKLPQVCWKDPVSGKLNISLIRHDACVRQRLSPSLKPPCWSVDRWQPPCPPTDYWWVDNWVWRCKTLFCIIRWTYSLLAKLILFILAEYVFAGQICILLLNIINIVLIIRPMGDS